MKVNKEICHSIVFYGWYFLQQFEKESFLIRDKNTLVTIGTDHYAT